MRPAVSCWRAVLYFTLGGVCVCVLLSETSETITPESASWPGFSVLGPTVPPKVTWWEGQDPQDLSAGRASETVWCSRYFWCCRLDKPDECGGTAQVAVISHWESLAHEVVGVISQAICTFRCTISINLLPAGRGGRGFTATRERQGSRPLSGRL